MTDRPTESRVPWTEDDLTSEEDAERATHSESKARELRKLAEELQEADEEGFGRSVTGSLLHYARRLAEERTVLKLRIRELEAELAARPTEGETR